MKDFELTPEDKNWCEEKARATAFNYEFISSTLIGLKGSKIGTETYLDIYNFCPESDFEIFKKEWLKTFTFAGEDFSRNMRCLLEGLRFSKRNE